MPASGEDQNAFGRLCDGRLPLSDIRVQVIRWSSP
jgi:hypothetical protein